MFSFYDFFDTYELLKAVVIAFIIVLMVRAWAYASKDRAEKEEKIRELEDGEKEVKLLQQIIPVSKSIYEENNCSICKKPIWTREGLEIDNGCTVELKCTHRFHWNCLNKKTSSSSLTDTSYVMVDKVPMCPDCHFQPAVIEAKSLHKWQTIRYWVLIIDEALDQLATKSGKQGISWANVRARARKMSGITLEQLAKGEEQTYGKEDMHAEEDLDGPGKFPYFAALKDGNAERFQDTVDSVYHKSAGKWLTYQSDRGGERMVFKFSWGIPPFTNCHNCDKFLNATELQSTGGERGGWKECKVCGHSDVMKLYWCSEECYASHGEYCNKLLNKMERFRVTKSLS